eukprot:SM000002S05776  [mRNA]  locus=s2:2214455:2217622:+ [translate_table: standard]
MTGERAAEALANFPAVLLELEVLTFNVVALAVASQHGGKLKGFQVATDGTTGLSNKEWSPEPRASAAPSDASAHERSIRCATDRGASGNITLLGQSTTIHASSVVHPDAVLGEGVEVGPLCTIGPGVKVGAGSRLHPGCHLAGDTEIGEGCEILSGAIVGADIPGRTVIGDNNKIGYHAVVGGRCQDLKYKDGSECYLTIGHNNDIREHVSIHRSSKVDACTVIGDNNLIMGACHVAHDCILGNRNILANGTLLAGHVVLEDFVHTGGAVAVHQFCQIGSYSFLAGGSMVDRDVPVYMMVAGDRAELRGLNLEGMRRCGFSDEEVKSIRRAYQRLFMNSDVKAGGLEDRLTDLEGSLDDSSDAAVTLLVKSVRASFGDKRRGICKFRHWTSV